MHAESALMKEIAEAVHSEDFPRFEKIVEPLIDFTNAGGITPPIVTDPELAALLEDYIDPDLSYKINHLDLFEIPDEMAVCEFVDRHVTPSPIPGFREWDGWEYASEYHRPGAQSLINHHEEDSDGYWDYIEHQEIIIEIYNQYVDDYDEAQQKEWLYEIFGEIVKDHKAEQA